MTKHLLTLFLFSIVAFVCYGQTYNPVNYNFNGTPTYGVKIKTNLPYCSGCQMPTLILEGYDYDGASPIGISIVYYIYSGQFIQAKASSWGGYTPVIKLANENEKVVVFIDDRRYYNRFSVRAFAKGMGEEASWFQGWTVADEPLNGSSVTVPYQSNLNGEISLPGNGKWTQDGKVGIGNSSPGSKLDLFQEVADNSNLVVANFLRGGTQTGGSTILRLGYYGTSDLEQNGMYSSSGWRYGTWGDLNLVNNGFGPYGGLNLVTQSNIRMSVLPGGNIGIGTTSPRRLLTLEKNVANGVGAGLMLVNQQYSNNNGAQTEILFTHLFQNGNPLRYAKIHTVGEDVYGHASRLSFGITNWDDDVYRDILTLNVHGNVGIGTTNPQNKLDVNGTVHAKEFKASLDGWADFVFEDDYKLISLQEVENYVKSNKKLKDIPSAGDVKKNGVNLGDMQITLLQKIEELTLYIIQQDKKLMEQEKINTLHEGRIKELEEIIKKRPK